MSTMRFSEDRIEQLMCSDGIKRKIHIWEPEKPRAVFLTIHGGMDHGGNYITVARFMKQHGFATVAHDQHGHDQKNLVYIPRFEVFLDDIELMLNWVKNAYPGLPIVILSHSMGGLVSTHFGIRRFKGDPLVKGFVASSPYYVNAIKTPWIVRQMAGLLSFLAPKMKVPIEDVRGHVTHDQEIMDRQQEDVNDDIMASGASARFASELLKAQGWIGKHIREWSHPMLVILAGQDRLADTEAAALLLEKVGSGLLTQITYPDNYHENFNELNRNEVFQKILDWVEPRLEK